MSDESEPMPQGLWGAKVFENLRVQESEAARLAAHPPPRLVASTPEKTEAPSDQAKALAKIFAKAKFERRFKLIAEPPREDGQG